MARACHHLIIAAALGLLWAPAALAQGAAEAPQPLTTADTKVDLKTLALRLKPLRKAELEVELEGWLKVLEARMSALVEKEIELDNASGELDLLRREAQDLKDERTQLIDRIKLVADALEAKGGDAAEARQYVEAVQGLDVRLERVEDVEVLIANLKGWALSPEGGIRWVKNIVLFILALFIFKILSWIAGRAAARLVRNSRNMSSLLREFFVTVATKTVSFIGWIVALSMLEVNVGPFVAGIGAIGFIVAFALQGTLSNFAAGIMILAYRPYDVGDFVEVAGVSGSVNAMNLVSTTILTGDNQVIVVPNSNIWGGVIRNVTGKARRRVDLVFGIGYGDDIGKAEAILRDCATKHPKVLNDPPVNIRVSELADSSVNLICRPWARTPDYWDVYWDLTRTVKERFDAEGISIPFPQRDVHIFQEPQGGPEAPPAAPSAPEPLAAAPDQPLVTPGES